MNIRDAADVVRRARSPRELARLVPRWRKQHVLNAGAAADAEVVEAVAAVRGLRTLRNRIKGEGLDDNGRVDYAKLRASAAADELQEASRILLSVRPAEIAGDSARIAFWTNLYNVLSIHGVLSLGIRESVMEIPSFFGSVAYQVGAHTYTLDDIENGVLRCNGRHPASKKRLFADDDPRRQSSPSQVDARIHSALVCASKSCPPVGFYDPEHLDDQLRRATEHYVAHGVTVDKANAAISYPITFHYYSDDFVDVPAFVLKHAPDELRTSLERAYAADYKIKYKRYDWSLNSII